MGGEQGEGTTPGNRAHARRELLWLLVGGTACHEAGPASRCHKLGKPAHDWRGGGLHRKQASGWLGAWSGAGSAENGLLGFGTIEAIRRFADTKFPLTGESDFTGGLRR